MFDHHRGFIRILCIYKMCSRLTLKTIGVRGLGLSGEAEWYDEEEDLDGSTTEFFFSVGILF